MANQRKADQPKKDLVSKLKEEFQNSKHNTRWTKADMDLCKEIVDSGINSPKFVFEKKIFPGKTYQRIAVMMKELSEGVI